MGMRFDNVCSPDLIDAPCQCLGKKIEMGSGPKLFPQPPPPRSLLPQPRRPLPPPKKNIYSWEEGLASPLTIPPADTGFSKADAGLNRNMLYFPIKVLFYKPRHPLVQIFSRSRPTPIGRK